MLAASLPLHATAHLLGREDDLVRVHRRDCAQRNDELTRVLDIDEELGPAERRDLPDGADFLPAVGEEDLKTDVDVRQLHLQRGI